METVVTSSQKPAFRCWEKKRKFPHAALMERAQFLAEQQKGEKCSARWVSQSNETKKKKVERV